MCLCRYAIRFCTHLRHGTIASYIRTHSHWLWNVSDWRMKWKDESRVCSMQMLSVSIDSIPQWCADRYFLYDLAINSRWLWGTFAGGIDFGCRVMGRTDQSSGNRAKKGHWHAYIRSARKIGWCVAWNVLHQPIVFIAMWWGLTQPEMEESQEASERTAIFFMLPKKACRSARRLNAITCSFAELRVANVLRVNELRWLIK